jgi:hypothetical protein
MAKLVLQWLKPNRNESAQSQGNNHMFVHMERCVHSFGLGVKDFCLYVDAKGLLPDVMCRKALRPLSKYNSCCHVVEEEAQASADI